MKPPSDTCRNCGGNDFHTGKADFRGDNYYLLDVAWFSTAEATVRVCGDCGLVEWFVTEKTLEKVKKNMPRK